MALGVQNRQQIVVTLFHAAIDLALVQRELQRGMQIARTERFDDIAIRLDLLGAFQRGRIDVCREKHNRNAKLVANLSGGIDSVGALAKMHVHQHQIRL